MELMSRSSKVCGEPLSGTGGHGHGMTMEVGMVMVIGVMFYEIEIVIDFAFYVVDGVTGVLGCRTSVVSGKSKSDHSSEIHTISGATATVQKHCCVV